MILPYYSFFVFLGGIVIACVASTSPSLYELLLFAAAFMIGAFFLAPKEIEERRKKGA